MKVVLLGVLVKIVENVVLAGGSVDDEHGMDKPWPLNSYTKRQLFLVESFAVKPAHSGYGEILAISSPAFAELLRRRPFVLGVWYVAKIGEGLHGLLYLLLLPFGGDSRGSNLPGENLSSDSLPLASERRWKR